MTNKVYTIREVILAANSNDVVKAEGKHKKSMQRLQGQKDKLNEGITSISEQLMIAATSFGIDVEKFLDACKVEEDYIKSEDAGSNQVAKMSNAWMQAKSRIKAAMLEGFAPSSFDTESSMREAVKQSKDVSKNGEALTVEGDIATSVELLMEVLHTVSMEEQAQISSMVNGLTQDIKLYLSLEQEESKVA